MFYTYILKSSKKDKYYIGNSSDLVRRLLEHNSGKTESTRSGIPWELVYCEEFPTRKDAVGRERQIKSEKSKTYIQNLLRKRRPV